MWNWSLNWGQVTPSITVGSCPMTQMDIIRIRDEAGASAVLSLQHDDCLDHWNIDYDSMRQSGDEIGLRMERCPIRDFDISDMRRQLPAAISALSRLINNGYRVYLHCTAGLGRSPLVTLGYLTLVETHSPEDAIQLILKARTDAVPAWEAYHGCREDLVNQHRHSIEKRAFELYEQGIHTDPNQDWLQAEIEILRTSLL